MERGTQSLKRNRGKEREPSQLSAVVSDN